MADPKETDHHRASSTHTRQEPRTTKPYLIGTLGEVSKPETWFPAQTANCKLQTADCRLQIVPRDGFLQVLGELVSYFWRVTCPGESPG